MNIDKIIQFLIVIIIFIIIIILLRQAVAEKKEKRIAYYSLEPLKDASVPLIDKIKNKYGRKKFIFTAFHLFCKKNRENCFCIVFIYEIFLLTSDSCGDIII